MRKLAIIGGKLQGLEAVYLAQKAGIETFLIDKKENTPARKMADNFLCANVLDREERFIDLLKSVDLILPALENDEVLIGLSQLAQEFDLPLAFDMNSYLISSSKKISDELIHNNDIPAPRYYPHGEGPYILKPSIGSGSMGVGFFSNRSELERKIDPLRIGKDLIVQEYLSGPSYSIEVIGKPGNYTTYEITELFMDEYYDCKRVAAPAKISDKMRRDFSEIAIKLATLLELKGIMDVEVIEHKGELKVLEIDARIPSQTPTVVYHSSGINLIEELFRYFCPRPWTEKRTKQKKHVSFEHLHVTEESTKVLGEHIMKDLNHINLLENFCGANEVLTDYKPEKGNFKGTFISIADSEEELNRRRDTVITEIHNLKGGGLKHIDLSPAC
jgi:3-methylornithine--L-lysine ligase